MDRIMAIDFGKKRVGIAVTDPLQMIASGLTTVDTNSVHDFIKKYTLSEKVSTVVVGESRGLNNSLNEVERDIQSFIDKLKNYLPNIEVKRVDERFTSSLAMDSLIRSGVKKSERRKKELLDEVSATLILQSYLEQKQRI